MVVLDSALRAALDVRAKQNFEITTLLKKIERDVMVISKAISLQVRDRRGTIAC